MYFKAIQITNFRKYGLSNNTIELNDAETYSNSRKNQDSINVASTVTLVVGRNNAGKTTVMEAIDKLVNADGKFGTKDFNIDYLRNLYELYKTGNYTELPEMRFVIKIGLDKGADDYVTNIVPFLTIGGVGETETTIIAKYEVGEAEVFVNGLKEKIQEANEKTNGFDLFCEYMDSNISLFHLFFYNERGQVVEQFRLKQLIEYVPIKVSDVEKGNALSLAFNKIVKYRYDSTFVDEKKEIEKDIEKMNVSLSEKIKEKHTKSINESLGKIISGNSIQVNLRADITFSKLMDNLIKYEYIDRDKYIPEDQFGLGYSNLMMIIAKLIDYIEKYPEHSFNSKINLIGIEEPETHMHPQMQEQFIQYINEAINILLTSKNKNVNSQLLVTTHSSHIVNSKIHTGGTFNNINYITEREGGSACIPLKDEVVTPDGNSAEEQFKFLKKHISFGISDVLFADAAILVEGITEHALLPYYIAKDEKLKHRYISIIKINGAHGLVYENLFKALGIPVAIITDLDINRTEEEKKNFTPIVSLSGRETTNQTIIHFNNGLKDISRIDKPIIDGNIGIFYQNKFESQYRTSFEEAFISKNRDNIIVNEVLEDIKPQIYGNILGTSETNYDNNSKKAYQWQRKLSESKSEFANEVLYKILTKEDDIPELPDYIANAFKYLEERMQ